MGCAEDAWGKYRSNWRAKPCQLCAGTKMSAEEYDAKVDHEKIKILGRPCLEL